MIKKIVQCTVMVLIAVFTLSQTGFTQVKAQKTRSSSRNTYGGYDFYGKGGLKSGYSKKNRKGGYTFYDSKGNKTGRLKPRGKSKSTYIYYDADGIRKGVIKKRASGSFSYRDAQSGATIESSPSVKGDVGSLSPSTIQGD
jgi:hypothetical protein